MEKRSKEEIEKMRKDLKEIQYVVEMAVPLAKVAALCERFRKDGGECSHCVLYKVAGDDPCTIGKLIKEKDEFYDMIREDEAEKDDQQ